MDAAATSHAFTAKIKNVTEGLSSTRELLKTILDEKESAPTGFDTRNGISLLSLKHHLMFSYLEAATLLIAHRGLGHSLTKRSPPNIPFDSSSRPARGDQAGDLVDRMVEDRLVLEKIKVLEGRMKYQIEKLVRVATEKQSAQNTLNGEGPLSFRPNLQNLEDHSDGSDTGGDGGDQEDDGVYRPPKVAPMPYTEPKSKKDHRTHVPAALHALTRTDPSKPHIETTSGLGNMAALMSKRARELQEMVEWEEMNMARLVMKKKDARRRVQDEADIVLGGIGAGGRRGGGLVDEFDDVLRSVSQDRRRITGDGYEELRQRGKKVDVLGRAKARKRDDISADEVGAPRQRKRSRFEKAIKASKVRSKRK
ncbi:hypothetical protein BDM02DRAFT_3111387 [Thelephora ganbajun]|uniref:Uncharacterized protein n=1 Tax=Thelephora ganbajun TaxID=370292 RepID=A0ACB6ZMI3_THEGA|nr:hypothetical protein BDM02DRAFT_3111387 [Thelephora ganbajun]